MHRRIVIPAAGFYEWDRSKNKNVFYLADEPVMYLAGCYKYYEDSARFVIFTREANHSMEPVHDRMPIILKEQDLEDWVYEDGKVQEFFNAKAPELTRKQEYEQLRLF